MSDGKRQPAAGTGQQAEDLRPDGLEPPGAATRIDDPELRSAFGLDGDDATWLGMMRRAREVVPLGMLGPYELLAEAGRGAQGTVYKAEHRRTKRVVALKRLPLAGASPGGSARARARFEREIEAACALDHAAVVRVHSADVIDGHAVIAMEWVEGRAIDRWAADGARPVGEVVALFTQVCDGVAHAHQRGVIHRDLKPSNIMVGEDGRARVLDFGLAKLVDEGGEPISHATGFLGTPAYAAPEQVAGGAADTRSDVYALGVVLYELLAGEHPFDKGAGVAVLFDQVRRGVGRAPSSVRPAVGRELDAIVHKATALDAADRYQSAEALASDLRRFLGGETVVAHPPSTMYRLRKLARRHRAAVGVAVAGAGLVLAFLIVVTILAVRLSGERRRLLTALASEHGALVDAHSARQSEAQARKIADDAATAARAASEQAQRETAHAQSALAFLTHLLEEAGGRRGLRANVPVRDVLARAAAELDTAGPATDWQTAFALRLTIGASYRSLGLAEQAEHQMRKALALAQKEAGPESLQAAQAWNRLGSVLEFGGALAEAEACQRQSLAIREKLDGGVHPLHSVTYVDLGSVLDEQDRFLDAEAAYTRGLELRLRLPDQSPARLAAYYRNVALEQIQQGRYAEAEATIKIALDHYAKGGRRGTESHHRAVRNLARIYAATGRADRAVKTFAPVVEQWAAQLGDDHPQVARERAILAGMMVAAGRPEEAIPIYRASVAALAARFPASHPWVVRTRVELAGVLVASGAAEEAEAVAWETLEDAVEMAPGSEALLAAAAARISESMLAQGRPDDAWRIAGAAALELAARLPADDERLARCAELWRRLARESGAAAVTR